MCLKQLNPAAQEWRPTPPPTFLLPHHLFHPPPHTTTAPPHFYHYPHPHPTFICRQPLCYVSYFNKAPPSPPLVEGKSTNVPSMNPLLENTKKGYSRVLPPRLRRSKPPPPPPLPAKKTWKPKAVSNNSGDSGSSHSSPPSYTTVMIKNIPNQLRRDFMLKFLDGHCKAYSLEYDFLYLPMDFRMKYNLGYAFVNFTTAVAANNFKIGLQDYKWGVVYCDEVKISSKKICDITWARVQGKNALTRRFENSHFTCDELEFLPVILDPPRNGDDPNPPPPVTVGRLYGYH